jgi:Mg2+/Co2+ transporter CorC
MLSMFSRRFVVLEKDLSCEEALHRFKKERVHLAIVIDKSVNENAFSEKGELSKPNECMRIVTLEDIIEEILQDEIVDENDDEGKDVRMIRQQIVEANEKKMAEDYLGKNQITAISAFLHKFIGPFAHLEEKKIEILVRASEVVSINQIEDEIVQ